MNGRIDVRRHLETYIGRTVKTFTGRENTILRIEGDSVFVKTERSPAGEPVPIECLQIALEQLATKGEMPLKFHPLNRYRGSFFLAVLLSLPGVVPKTYPTRAVVNDRDALERFLFGSSLEFRDMLKTSRK